jgi:dihydrofolate reductase
VVWSLDINHRLEQLVSSIPERKQRIASLILKMSVSLDGYVASRDGSTGWLAAGRSDDSTRWVLETVSNGGAHLIGAATYAEWEGYWPTASDRFAKAMNEIPKVV